MNVRRKSEYGKLINEQLITIEELAICKQIEARLFVADCYNVFIPRF